ncbi:unnamed protein product [Pylaiella littoralis]
MHMIFDRPRRSGRQHLYMRTLSTPLLRAVPLLPFLVSSTTAFAMLKAKAPVTAGPWRAPAATAPVQLVGGRGRLGVELGCAVAAEPVSGTARPLELWLDARGASADDAVDWEAFQESADAVLLCDGSATGSLGLAAKRRLVVKDDGKLLDGSGNVIGASLPVTDPKSQSRALSLVGSVDWIQVTCSDWTMIPAENLVSAAGGTPTRIAVELFEPSQVQGAAFALELGVDGLLLKPDTDLWAAAVSAREQRNDPAKNPSTVSTAASTTNARGDAGGSGGGGGAVALSVGKVTRTKEGGIGDRVCVDLIQSLKAGEGMFVGSSAKMLALVHAETFETGFVPARPFRINAGPVHSYALLADGSTKYLSELCAGDQVLVTNWKGESRKVAIGRLKVETRPMIMVEFQGENGSVGQVFLQQAETVRLISPSSTTSDGIATTDNAGKALGEEGTLALVSGPGSRSGSGVAVEGWRPLSVTDVEGGETLLLREKNRGTHVGRAIDAVVTET